MSLKETVLEIYMAFKRSNGSLTAISGFLGRDDSSKLSRQINPNDDRRDNPYMELLEIHAAMVKFSPAMEEEIWCILERVRNDFRAGVKERRAETSEQIQRVYGELGDVIFKHSTNAPHKELAKEAFEVKKAADDLYENIIGACQSKAEIQEQFERTN